MTDPLDHDWWRRAVVYQIYPRSFQDSNNDGIGDLQGIVDRLDYLNDGTDRSLGVDAIWLSPTFPSPMKDFGYDVSDYRDVHPDFGDLAAMDRLITECHKRDIRVLLDYVPNHTSDQHPWFVESRASRDNPKRDWYIWRDPKPDGGLPNNWYAVFGGNVWAWDEYTAQYYLHSFLVEQPDLNWRNPEVVSAMHDVLRFWMARGIDGFRIDVMGMIVKHPDLADNPLNPRWTPESPRAVLKYLRTNMQNYPDVFPAVKGIRRVLDEFPGTMAVGEVFGSSEEIANFYGGHEMDGLHLAFNFQLINETWDYMHTPWDAETLRRIVGRAERELPRGAQPCYAIGNHDRPRFVSRYDDDGFGQDRARAAVLLLLGLRNTPFVYYGDEIGMTDVEIPPERQQDPARLRTVGRDPERTPMQWDGSAGRGFSRVQPWLPYGAAHINAEDQSDNPDSLLSLYRRAIWCRKREPALWRGDYTELGAARGVFAFLRRAEGVMPVIVAINTSLSTMQTPLPEGRWRVLAASHLRHEEESIREGHLEIPPLGALWLAGGA